jgi:Serine aminopeptidase, S33
MHDIGAQLAGLICESFAFQVAAPDFAVAVVRGLSHLAPHAHVLRLKNEEFSRDPEVVQAMNDDPLIANEVQPTNTVAELARADERLKKEFPLITLPVLILHGTADTVTRPSGSQLFYDTAGSTDKTLKLYEGHVHDLLNDIDKEVLRGVRPGRHELRDPSTSCCTLTPQHWATTSRPTRPAHHPDGPRSKRAHRPSVRLGFRLLINTSYRPNLRRNCPSTRS